MYGYSEVFLVQRFLDVINMSDINKAIPHGCDNGALTDRFGVLIQGLLGIIAFSTLMLKRFREPARIRRPWRIWFYDTSKQAIGSLFIHFANIFLSTFTKEDPCSLYLMNFLLDATLGMLVIWLAVKLVSRLVEYKQWSLLTFGEYGDPPQAAAWLGQCGIYLLIMVLEKGVVSLVLLIPGWSYLQEVLLGYIDNPQLELVLVMLIVPFIVNSIMFWVVDSLMMRKYKTMKTLDDLCDSTVKKADSLLHVDQDETQTDIVQQERHKRAILTSEEQEDFEAVSGDDISVKSYKIESQITSRFAHTTVRSHVINSGTQAQSIGFNVQIPKRAFITNFTMNVNGITFKGSVKEKTVARNLYAQARARGKAAGIVRANSQDMETFKTEVHVPPGSNIEFELHYQEMMQRKLGFYEHQLYLQPGRLVSQFQVDVYIFEPKGISKVETPNTLGEPFTELIKVTTTNEKAHIVFKPNLQLQRKCHNCTGSAIDGILTVRYDTKRDNNAGELQVSDGHFVHFFAPSNLSPLPKNIVFVIDVSGSMWGVKMKQTVEAMQAILDDLAIDDHFSVIDFNHNVRCWSDDLVPASNIQIADAKKYIQDIKPNGGTNINEALMRAVQMLVRASNQGLIDSRSVSMIILVSDGDPTVGEIKLSTIQKNVKRVMREKFSLFSLGIGFDVDYDFLERIAMENRGMAQRIYANHNAADQLRAFFSQVSAPLLRRITVQFPEDSVSDITQNQFDKFFSGSELVVAGKVLPSDTNTLTSFTTASAARFDLTLETEADTLELDAELARQHHSFPGFARQLWAYITIKQLLGERSMAPTAVKKRKITQRIMSLAVEHQFVTPLTALLVESDDATERLLADSPKDPKHGCCSGGGFASPGVTKVGVVYQPPPWILMTTPAPPSQAEKGPEEWTIPQQVNLVDNDPHFIIHLPRSNMDVCFNIDSKPGHILNLVSDSGTGVVINGQLVGSKKLHKNKLNTYFGTISVYSQPEGVSVIASTENITMSDGRNHHTFSWAATTEITQDSVRISIVKNSHVTITINNNIEVTVLLHRIWKKHPINVDFLGIYIPTDNQYSPLVHGLIGQFSTEPEATVYDVHEGVDPLKKKATMEVKGHKLGVTRGWQKDYRTDKTHGSEVHCWFVHNSGKGFIDGHYTDYIVPDLNSFL